MATITAVKTGNWTDTTVWDLGRAPLDGDTVLAAEYTIEFDADISQPNTLLNATSGNFRYSGVDTRNVTANANVGTHTTAGVIQITNTGTLNFSGEIKGGSGSNAYGAFNNAAGTLTVTTATGGNGYNAYGARNNAAGTLTVTTATGGSGYNAYGAFNNAAGTLTVTTATGGNGYNAYGAFNNAAGTLTVTTATGGSGPYAYGAHNSAAGTLTFGVAVGNDWGPGGTHSNANFGVYGSNTVGAVTCGKAIRFGAHGMIPVGGAVKIVADAALNQAVFVTDYSGGTLTLLDATAAADFPLPANVRSGTRYDNGDKLGTCAVPGANDVAYGIPVDATTGTAVLTAAAVAAAAAAAILATPANKLATDASGRVTPGAVTLANGAHGGAAATLTLATPVHADLRAILGTALTETAGQIAAAFKKFFNVAAPTGTVNSLPDARPGTLNGLPVSNINGNVPVDVLALDGDGDAAVNLATAFATSGKLTADIDGSIGGLATGAAQAVRDALKLAPSSGSPATGSIDKQLAALAQPGDDMGLSADALAAIAAAVGSVVTVNASVALSATQAEQIAEGLIAIAAYADFAQGVTSTSADDLAAAEDIWFGIKARATDADADAILLLSAEDGLVTLAGATYATPAHGALTVSGTAGAWTVAATLTAAATARLTDYAGRHLVAEIKYRLPSGAVRVLWSGLAAISRGVIQRTA